MTNEDIDKDIGKSLLKSKNVVARWIFVERVFQNKPL